MPRNDALPALPHRQRGKALDRAMAEHPRPVPPWRQVALLELARRVHGSTGRGMAPKGEGRT